MVTLKMDLNFEVLRFGGTSWLIVSSDFFAVLRLEIGKPYLQRSGESVLLIILRAYGMVSDEGVNTNHPLIAKVLNDS